MVFDRAGAYPGAVSLYREGAAILNQALHLCPESHPDYQVIEAHVQQLSKRAAYLQSLGVQPAEIPLEEHIQGAQLQLGPCANRKTAVAAGAVGAATGLVLSGPLAGVAVAAGAVYATTRQDRLGSIARNIGDSSLQAVDSVKSLSDRHQLDRRLDEKLHISDAAKAVEERLHVSAKVQAAADAARSLDARYAVSGTAVAAAGRAQSFVASVDERYSISCKSQAAVSRTAQALNEFDEKHHVTWKLNQGISSASSALSSWATKAVSGFSQAERSRNAGSSPS